MRTARNRHRCPLARKAMVDTPTTGKAPPMNPTRSTSPGTVRRWSAAAIAAVAVTLGGVGITHAAAQTTTVATTMTPGTTSATTAATSSSTTSTTSSGFTAVAAPANAAGSAQTTTSGS